MPYANLTTILIQQQETIEGTELKINNTSSDSITFSLNISKHNENLTTVYIDGTLYEGIRATKSISITLSSGEHTILISGDQYFNFNQYIIGSNYQEYLSSAKLKTTYSEILERTFQNCSNLTNVELGNDITTIGAYCFLNCSSLRSIVLSNSLTSLKNGCFENCSSLTSLTLPDSVTLVGSYLCSKCTSLTYLKLPNGLTTINTYLIEKCSNLTSITIPDSVTTIEESAFHGPHGLTSITIPANVTTIGRRAFSTSSRLKSVKITATTPPTAGTYMFEDCYNLTKIYVPVGTLSTYQTATNWTAYADKMEEYND